MPLHALVTGSVLRKTVIVNNCQRFGTNVKKDLQTEGFSDSL